MTTPPPQFPPRRRISEPLGESVRVLGRYVRAQLLIAVVLTVLYAVGFAIARVPFWPVIAILGGLSSFIPRVGSLVPLALAMIAELLGDRNMTHFLIAFAAWILIQALEGFFITPRLLSK